MRLFSALPKNNYYTFHFTDELLAVAKIDTGGKKLAFYQEYPLPKGSISRNEIINPENILNLLQEIKVKNQLDNKFIVLGISDEQCLTHTLVLPPLEIPEIDQAIEYQADSFLPFPYKKECIDWMLVKTNKDGKKIVLINAIPLNIINDYISIFEKANFHPIAFETTSLSLFRSIPSEGHELCLGLNVDKLTNTLILCKSGSIEATSLVYNQNQLLETLKKLLNFYFTEDKSISSIKMYSAGIPLPNVIINQFKNENIEILPLESKLFNPANRSLKIPVILDSLLKKQVEPPRDEKSINIIPASQLEKYQNIFLARGGIKIIRILISLLFFLTIVMAFAYYRLTTQVQELQKTPVNTIAGLDTVSLFRLYGVKAGIINKIDLQNKLLKNLSSLSKNPPPGITILNIAYDKKGSELIISGEAKNRDDLYGYKETLEKMKIFKKVTIPVSFYEKEININYRIICKI